MMEQERIDTVRRCAETPDVLITADSVLNDFLFPDNQYSICGASTSSELFLDEVYNKTPLENLGNGFTESYDVLFRSDQSQLDSDCMMDIVHDVNYSVLAEPAYINDSLLLDKQTPVRNNNRRGSGSAFVEWQPNNTDFLHPKKNQSALKRCIRLLKDIDSHKIARPLVQGHEIDSAGCSRLRSNYDKLAIHHVVAERKRREQMNDIFSALRELIPVSPKKGRATVLQHTKDYIIHLKSRIEELERRNRELEVLLGAESADRGD